MLCRRVSEEEEASLCPWYWASSSSRWYWDSSSFPDPAACGGWAGQVSCQFSQRFHGEIGEDVVFVTERVKKRYD